MAARVWEAGPDDAAALIEIAEAHWRYYAAFEALGPFDAARVGATIARVLEGPRPLTRAFLAADAGGPLGALYFSTQFPGADFRCAVFIKDLFVRAEARRRGVARALLAATRAEAERLDADRVELHTHPDAADAKALYARLGFSRQDRDVWRLPLPDRRRG